MLAPLIVAGLFLAGAIFNLVRANLPNAGADLCMAGVLLWLAWFICREDRISAEYIARLLHDPVFRGNVGNLLSAKVRRYRLTFSIVILSFTFQTRYYPAESPMRWFGWGMCMLLTLVFGWWHIPFGPFHTLGTLIHNIRGGQVQTVQQVLEEVDMVKGELRKLRITLEATTESVVGYVYLQDIAPAQAAETRQIAPDIFADYDSQGNLLGVEFLQAQKADAKVMDNLASELHAPELAGIDLSRMCATE